MDAGLLVRRSFFGSREVKGKVLKVVGGMRTMTSS